MKVELEVLASTNIKRKKPWPRLAFLGETQESMFLLDAQRLSVLYVPSGKTKKKVPKLNNLLPNVLIMNHSHNGHFLAGLLRSGDLFLWHKDTDTLKTVPGVPDLAMLTESAASGTESPRAHLFIADDARKLLVVLNYNLAYVWELALGSSFNQRHSQLAGHWSQVLPDTGTLVSDISCHETDVHAAFFVDQSQGQCCECSMAFNTGSQLCITTLHLRWHEMQDIYSFRKPLYTAEWTSFRQPLNSIVETAQPIRSRGAYLVRHSQDGQLVAVAVNQHGSHLNRMLFYSANTDTVIVVDMKGTGMRRPVTEEYRQYWVADMQWTCDNLFLACMTKQGSLCLLTRLGEPLLIQTFGCNIEMGPKPYLPLHPLVTVKSTKQTSSDAQSAMTASMAEEKDLMRQRFSVTTHPGFPIIVCSDGYMVSVLQLPVESSCLSIMKALVMESNSLLRRARDKQKMTMTLFDSLRKQGKLAPKDKRTGHPIQRLGLAGSPGKGKPQRVSFGFQFEEAPNDALNATIDSDIVDYQQDSPMKDLDGGQIFFGDVDNLNQTLDYRAMLEDTDDLAMAECLDQTQRALMLAWGLASSHSGLWMLGHEELSNNIGHNLVRLFTVILNSPASVIKELDAIVGVKQQKKLTRSKKSRHLSKVLSIFKTMLRLLHLDTVYKHMMVCAFNFIHSTVDLLLHNKDLKQHEPRTQTLHGAYMVLKFCESSLTQVYSSVHKAVQVSSIPYEPQLHYSDLFEPAVLVQVGWYLQCSKDQQGKARSVDPEDTEVKMSAGSDIKLTTHSRDLDSQIVASELPQAKRLSPVWKLLYRQILAHHNLVLSSGGGAGKLDKVSRQELRATLRVLVLVQCKLHALGQQIPAKRLLRIHHAEKLSIEGSATPAVQAWVRHLNSLPEDKLYGRRGTRSLHAILYTLVMQNQLRSAVELMEFLLRQDKVGRAAALCRTSRDTRLRILSLLQEPAQLSDKVDGTTPVPFVSNAAVRCVVRSMARLMASYFSNRAMFVYAPHCPYKLPSLLADTCVEGRIIPLYHDCVTSVLRREGLSEVWTPERTLHYLLLGGLLHEAVWFLNTLGDWKAAFLLSVACQEHMHLAPAAYERTKVKPLPDELKPESLLQDKLKPIFKPESTQKDRPVLVTEDTNLEQLTKTLSDMLLAATICHIDINPWLLEGLAAQLKVLGSKFTPLVPEGLYLPAPPVYCPQPPITDQDSLSPDVLHEVRLRQEASSIVQLALLVLNSSHTTLPAARWYVHKVVEAFAKGLKFQRDKQNASEIVIDIQVLQDSFLPVASSFQGSENDPSIHKLLACFRELCCLLWMLYARDQLSLMLRQKHFMLQKKASRQKVSQAELQLQCQDTLRWALHMLPFSQFLDGEYELYSAALSQLVELPADESTARIMVEHFHDFDSLHPEIQEKLKVLQKEWQGVFLGSAKTKKTGGSPRGLTLSVYFERQAMKMSSLHRKKSKTFGHYEASVFDTSAYAPAGYAQNGIMFVGARPFESAEDYLKFLDVFYAVSFTKAVDAERESAAGPEMPLLQQYSAEIRAKELNSLPHRAITNLQRRESREGHAPRSPRQDMVSSPRRQKSVDKAKLPPSPRRKLGLFRSHSLTDVSPGKTKVRTASVSPIRERSLSELDLSNLSMEDLDTSQTKPPMKHISRSTSVQHREKTHQPSSPRLDPLADPLLQVALLEGMDFGKKYSEPEQLLEWLTRWADRSHTVASARGESGGAAAKAIIKMKLVPRIIIYALWQVEYNNDPNMKPPRPPDGTGGPAKKRKKKTETEMPAERTETQAEVNQDISITGLDDPHLNIDTPTSVVKLKDPDKKKKKKKKEPKKQKKPRADEEPEMMMMQESSQFAAGSSRGFRVSEPQPEQVEISVVALDEEMNHAVPKEPSNSESSLNISSLVGEEGQEMEVLRHAELTGTLPTQGTMKLDDLNNSSERRRKKKKPRPLRNSELTDASMNTSMRYPASDGGSSQAPLVDEMRQMVRTELRVMMEAQHQGVLAMLGALEGDAYTDSARPSPRQPLSSSRTNHPTNQPPHDYVVLTAQHSEVHPDLSKPRSRSSTDVDVTPLPSDELSVVDKPLSMGELAQVTPRHEDLPGLLQELRLLERQQSGEKPTTSTSPPKQHTADTNKENVNNAAMFAPGYFSNIQQSNQPFDRVMGMLRMFNNSQAQPQGPQQHRNDTVHFPKIPTTAWPENNNTNKPPVTDTMGRIPLLQIDNHYAPPPGSYHTAQMGGYPAPPGGAPSSGGRAPSSGGGAPLPLLYMPDNKSTLSLFQDPHGTPRLVPPEVLLDYEQKRSKKDIDRKTQAFQIAQQVAAQRGHSPPRPENLLQGDVQAFGPWYDVDNAKRQKRRKKKLETKKDGDSTSKEDSDVTVIKVKEASPRRPPKHQHQRDEEDEESTPLNHGYALTPGLFDDYLDAEDTAVDTNAKLQYKAAMAVQPKKKKDAAVETDPYMDKSTSITRDTATDPVSEAIEKYYRAKTGKSASQVAPDVFLGLRFADASGQPSTDPMGDGSTSNGRAFLNVVDINADMLGEITSTVGERGALKPQDEGVKGSPRRQTARSPSPEKHARLEAERDATTAEDHPPGPDGVTADLLGRTPDASGFLMPSADELARGSRHKTREAIRRRLEGMNDQFKAIASMTRNMEDEFKNTNLLMHTIEQMGEAIDPERDPDYPEAKVLQRFTPRESDVYDEMGHLKPSQVKKFRAEDRKGQSPRSQRSPRSPRKDKSPRADGRKQGKADDGDGELHVSGLSGISDILEEVLGQGKGHDLTQTQADELVEKALRSSRDGVRLSNEELKHVFDTKSPRAYPHRQQRRTEQERQELLAWMEKRRAERHKAQMQDSLKGTGKRDDLSRTVTKKELQDAEEQRSAKKREQEQETFSRRKQLASQLMGEILMDHPVLPPDDQPQPRPHTTPSRTGARTTTTKRATPRKMAPRRSEASPARPQRYVDHSFDADHLHVRSDDYMHIQDSYDSRYDTEYPAQQQQQQQRGYDPQMTDTGYTEEYEQEDEQAEEVAAHRAMKPRPFTDIVKLQRPEATRTRHQRQKPKPYVERLSQLSNAGSARSTPKSAREQQRLYGTSRIPGLYKTKERTAPRMVKTYTERLQDMKQNRPPSQPITPRSRTRTLGEARQQPPATYNIQRRPHKPRKTLTYAQQLQKLQPPKENYRTGQGTVRVRSAPVRHSSDGPPHKPKTYGQQLRELQAPPTVRHGDTYVSPDHRHYQVPPPRSVMRGGPYPDPYHEQDDLSEVTPWSMEDDVHNILYDGDTATASHIGASMVGTETDIENISELEQLAGLDYLERVDIGQLEQIADDTSVGSGSIMSFIDWDQIDMLIGDVK